MDDFCGCILTAEPLTGKLLGRTVEVNKILNNLTLSSKQSTSIIQTAAPSGSGKSALLQELVRIFINGKAVSMFFESLALTSTSGPDTGEVHPPQEHSIKGHEDMVTELKISAAGPAMSASAGPATPTSAAAVPTSATTSLTPTTKATPASSPKAQTISKSQEV